MLLRIDGLYNRINFSAAHFIPTIEKCSRIHGHDYSISLEIEGEPRDGILIDYGVVKGAVRTIIRDMDHKVLLPENSQLTRVKCDHRECVASYDSKEFRFPVGDVFVLNRIMTSSEMIADHIATEMADRLKTYRNLNRIQICVYEGPGQCTCQEKALHDD